VRCRWNAGLGVVGLQAVDDKGDGEIDASGRQDGHELEGMEDKGHGQELRDGRAVAAGQAAGDDRHMHAFVRVFV